jgi:hypothetical protein
LCTIAKPTYFTRLENKKPLTENLQIHFFFEFLIFNLAFFWRDFASKRKRCVTAAPKRQRRPLEDVRAICSVFLECEGALERAKGASSRAGSKEQWLHGCVLQKVSFVFAYFFFLCSFC